MPGRRLAVVVPVTPAVVFLLLFGSFRSLKNSLLILLDIPLATVVVGGLATSTVLTLLVIPALHKCLAAVRD